MTKIYTLFLKAKNYEQRMSKTKQKMFTFPEIVIKVSNNGVVAVVLLCYAIIAIANIVQMLFCVKTQQLPY